MKENKPYLVISYLALFIVSFNNRFLSALIRCLTKIPNLRTNYVHICCRDHPDSEYHADDAGRP